MTRIPAMPATAASRGQAADGRSGGLVLVLNSGSSSVKFALLLPGSGECLMAGIGARLGTPGALLRIRWLPAAAVEEPVPGGTHLAVVARVLDDLPGAGHRVVHGGERFTSSILVDDAVMKALRSLSHLALCPPRLVPAWPGPAWAWCGPSTGGA